MGTPIVEARVSEINENNLHSHKVTIEQHTIKSSYTSIVNPEEGLVLKFIEAPVINGTKCAKIEQQDVTSEIDYWSQAVLCCVLGANPPLGVIEGYVRRIWSQFVIDKVIAARKGLYLVRFKAMVDKDEVLKKGISYFDRKPFIVQFPELDVKYWGADSLSKIGSAIGIPLKIDKQTIDKTFLSYARLLIDIPLEGPFLEYVDYITDKGRRVVNQEKEKGQNQQHTITKFETQRRTARRSPPNMRGNDEPTTNSFQALLKTEIIDMISTQKHFYITFVYGYNNQDHYSRISRKLANKQQMHGDFNAAQYLQDRLGGDELQESEVREYAECIDHYELTEMGSFGAYYSCSNKRRNGKKLWSRIDRAFINLEWVHLFDFTQVDYLAEGISDYAPLKIAFLNSPKSKQSFKYCDMWSKGSQFHTIVERALQKLPEGSKMYQLVQDPSNRQLQEREREDREKYIDILDSSTKLMRQQTKLDWINDGDHYTKFIYSINDGNGTRVDGLLAVAKVMTEYYQKLLETNRTPILQKIIEEGPCLNMEQQLSLCSLITNEVLYTKYEILWTRWLLKWLFQNNLQMRDSHKGLLSIKREGVTSGHWVLRRIASPKVLRDPHNSKQANQNQNLVNEKPVLYRESYSYSISANGDIYILGMNPHISPGSDNTEVCLPKANERMGLKNLDVWNKAWIIKLVWEVAKKKDGLWIKWVHRKYLINKD
ncbi:LOW QUALITY PROTEIN: hypothetical protein Cgig2_025875 [Carnegiea gigantea]|uniref:DUF4283 domain-containing protein n=1 Tax=Carnegiea gigantea TaxID=171969 RepID=A0A9Q1JL13_9CARY|nr:LOW QUALITY PROTEIN: hypothetical protein Cgig2_025875 [Carnegiea gigantea]